jgi:UDP-N-acetylglucosamine acyltransferase
MISIHRTAIVHPSAQLGVGVFIGPKVVVCEGVRIGAYSVIGGMPEHRSFYDDYEGERAHGVFIGRNARIFEFVTVHSGTREQTRVDESAAVFNHAHVAHDSIVGRGATVGGGAFLAGHTILMEGATMSGRSCTHQFSIIGAYSFLSPVSFLKGHIPPGELWIGSPARPSGINEVGLHRAGLGVEQVWVKFGADFERLKKERPL